MRAPRTVAALLAVAVLAVTLAVLAPLSPELAPPPAGAIDHGKGRPGYCPSDVGVTVVVDFQQLGGQTIVRCFPSATRGTGLDALKGAGFQIAGVQRWGEAFICRIENRPSAVETLPIQGNSGYREMCIDTPPAAGYWSYWHAGNNCAWKYSQWGVKNRDFIPGGFEGWSFSLNATADTNPTPRIAAVRPGTAGGPCRAPDEPAPQTNNPSETQPRPPTTTAAPPPSRPSGGIPTDRPSSPGSTEGRGSTGSSPPGRGPDRGRPTATPGDRPGSTPPDSRGPDGDEPDDRPESGDGKAGDAAEPNGGGGRGDDRDDRRASDAEDPADNVSFTGGEKARDVKDILREQSGASPWAPPVAALVVVGLVAGAVLTARHRKRVRES